MGNTELENYMVPLITVFISGLFGLMVAVITWFLANKREEKKSRAEQKIKSYDEKENLYVSLLAIIDKMIRVIKVSGDFIELSDEISLSSARINIAGSEKVNEQLEQINNKFQEWSIAHKKSLPTKVGGTDSGIVSNLDSDYRKSADSIYQELLSEIGILVRDIKSELKTLKEESNI